MDCTQLAVLEETGDIALCCLLYTNQCFVLEPPGAAVHVVSERAKISLERGSGHYVGSLLLVTLDLSECDRAWSESVGSLFFNSTFSNLFISKFIPA